MDLNFFIIDMVVIVHSTLYEFLDQIFQKFQVDVNACGAEYAAYRKDREREYPMAFGENFSDMKKKQMLLYLVSILTWNYFRLYIHQNSSKLMVFIFIFRPVFIWSTFPPLIVHHYRRIYSVVSFIFNGNEKVSTI